MRVFVTGATGALGRHLVSGLVAAGHEVTATTRTPGKVAQLREAGADPVVVDGLDREAVIAAVRASAPERKELGWEPRYGSWREGFRAWVNGQPGAVMYDAEGHVVSFIHFTRARRDELGAARKAPINYRRTTTEDQRWSLPAHGRIFHRPPGSFSRTHLTALVKPRRIHPPDPQDR
ncbi:SDR family oxidoreductase [Pseudonocardia asaccharolytica]|uniref:NAD(P)-binding domain-containing protein n=1 Tax=Pseudonocardia asaccharolytica DSM 44247 = NBRC 16224 TaxID=1123024 RepID=A0A511CW61_9PSEU|nr:NAD(P)H-binding protein [Pseudonocardia asaccharolytica]GEL16707.1 hypothetical protein PA7_05440 [Pseudonocardia asaccharolytica DSM 44247 = NBRC 16224]